MLTNVDENGKYIEMPIKENREGETVKEKSIKLNPIKLIVNSDVEPTEVTDFEITTFDTSKYKSLLEYFEAELKPSISAIDYKEQDVKVFTDKLCYWYDADKETIVEAEIRNSEFVIRNYLGCGKIIIKSAFKKATKTKGDSITITVELTKDLQKDYEIIPYSPDEATNRRIIADFMAKYITRPFEYLDNVIGVELNFNKVFYIPEQLRKVTEIQAEIDSLENELSNLLNDLGI
jgi:type I restriction enzyme M protein